MTLVSFQYTSDPGTIVLVAAAAGRRIRVRRFLIACDANGYVQLLSDPLGGATLMTSRLYVAANRPVDLDFGRDGAVATAAGKALGLSSVSSSGSVKLAVMVWYEIVD